MSWRGSTRGSEGKRKMTDDGPAFEPFEQVEHTADLAYVARGRSLAELFENAALGLLSLLLPAGVVRPAQMEEFEAEGSDAEELLIAWLQEILFRTEVRHRIYASFHVRACEPPRLQASALGEALDPARHRYQREVKAVTWHDLRIVRRETASGPLFQVRIVVDV